MAWNEPVGQNNSPWGRRPGNGASGTSNLDDTVKAWQKKLESLWRGGGSGGGAGGPGSAGGNSFTALTIGLILVGVWLATGLFQVDAPERAVIQRFGKYVGERAPGVGWRWPWPIETVTKVNVSSIKSLEIKSRMLTADVNLVDLRCNVQYQLADPLAVLFRVRRPENTLQEVSESAIREIVGQSPLDQVLGASRQLITERTRELIQRTLNQYQTGIVVSSVNLTDVQVPEAVLASQRDANKAIEDRDRFSKEATAYANDILPKAQGTAQRQIQEAEGYKAQVVALSEGEASRFSQLATAYAASPDVTRQRLYIETVEFVMSRSRKVVLDTKGANGNGNVIYLPLDKLFDRSSAARGSEIPTVRQNNSELESVTIDGTRTRGDR